MKASFDRGGARPVVRRLRLLTATLTMSILWPPASYPGPSVTAPPAFGDDPAEAWSRVEAGSFLRDAVARTGYYAADAEHEWLDAWEEREEFPRDTPERSLLPVIIPRLESGLAQALGPDASLTLRFDRPVGQLRVRGPLPVTVTADSARRAFRLVPGAYRQGHTYPLQIDWRATSGEPLPPLNLQVSTPVPLTVAVNTQGGENLGLALPLRVTFSEPLLDRAKAKESMVVKTVAGEPVAGRWRWIGKRRLQFTPEPAWPASTGLEVSLDEGALQTERGGKLEAPFNSRFTTGTDRRIFVYLDSQRVTAVENGQVVRTFRVSTGKPKTPTSAGNFYIYDRYLHKTMRSRVPKGQPGYYLVEDVPYTQFFNGDMAFHGAFWHNGFGRPASHGCVNMATREQNKRWPTVAEDAGWLYQWASLGVPVTVFKDTPVEMATKSETLEQAPRPSPRPE